MKAGTFIVQTLTADGLSHFFLRDRMAGIIKRISCCCLDGPGKTTGTTPTFGVRIDAPYTPTRSDPSSPRCLSSAILARFSVENLYRSDRHRRHLSQSPAALLVLLSVPHRRHPGRAEPEVGEVEGMLGRKAAVSSSDGASLGCALLLSLRMVKRGHEEDSRAPSPSTLGCWLAACCNFQASLKLDNRQRSCSSRRRTKRSSSGSPGDVREKHEGDTCSAPRIHVYISVDTFDGSFQGLLPRWRRSHF